MINNQEVEGIGIKPSTFLRVWTTFTKTVLGQSTHPIIHQCLIESVLIFNTVPWFEYLTVKNKGKLL